MIVAFTGTREGMSDYQKELLWGLLQSFKDVTLAHGDCIGADAQAHEMAEMLNLPIVIYPPSNPKYRAYCRITEIPEALYEARDRLMVRSAGVVIAAPRGTWEQLRSGTWRTIRYAEKIGRPVVKLPRMREGESGV